MMNNTSAPKKFSDSSNEDTPVRNQKQTIFLYLSKHIATASMVTDATGIPQKCITRYKRDLEKVGRLWEIEKKTCKITGFKAWFITCNPDLFPINPQTKLF